MNIPAIIEVNPERCRGCRDCISVCPSPLANYINTDKNGERFVDINPKKCIACGECVRACKHGGRDYNDDTEKFFRDLGSRKIIIIAHPAIKAAFGEKWQSVLRWFKQNGADGVYDGAFGADIATWVYCKSMESGQNRKVISTHCPAVVRYMEIYHPDRIKDVSTVHSPISCEAVYVRDYVKKNYAVAALTPCPAMTLEFTETGHAEYNVTYNRLREHFRRKRIDFKNISENGLSYEFDDSSQGGLGGLFPYEGGLRDNLSINTSSVITIDSSGREVYGQIESFLKLSPDKRPDVFECLACKGGCPMGIGAYDEDEVDILEAKAMRRRIEIDGRSRRKLNFSGVDKNFKLFEDRLNPKSIIRKFEDLDEVPDKIQMENLPAEVAAFLDEIEPAGGTKVVEKVVEVEKIVYQPAPETAPAEAPAETSAPEEEDGEDSARMAQLRTAQGAVKLKRIADSAVNDINEIKLRLSGIDSTNSQAASMATIIENILSRVISTCRDNDYIDEEALPQLVTILDKLQSAVTALRTNLTESSTATEHLADAVWQAADITADLQTAANSLIIEIANNNQ